MSEQLTEAIAERDRILIDLDVEAAKTFITKHGGFVASASLDWLRILHLARYECTEFSPDVNMDSRIYLARTGAQTIKHLHPNSPYLRSAMDLIFPKDLFDALVTAQKAVKR